jgi:hypothetical protein
VTDLEKATDIERQYPIEYFLAPVHFAYKISEITKIPLSEAMDKYTGLYKEVIGERKLDKEIDPIWTNLMNQIENIKNHEQIGQIIYKMYCNYPHSIYEPNKNSEHAIIFGSLGYIYHPETKQARIHFFSKRSSESDLTSEHFLERKDDFKRLLEDIKANHPNTETIKSSTWLQNIPNYKNLFPKQFTDRLVDIGGSSYLGVWGQFVKGDGGGNQKRLLEFKNKLTNAKTMSEVMESIPLKVLEAVGPIQDFYEDYNL